MKFKLLDHMKVQRQKYHLFRKTIISERSTSTSQVVLHSTCSFLCCFPSEPQPFRTNNWLFCSFRPVAFYSRHWRSFDYHRSPWVSSFSIVLNKDCTLWFITFRFLSIFSMDFILLSKACSLVKNFILPLFIDCPFDVPLSTRLIFASRAVDPTTSLRSPVMKTFPSEPVTLVFSGQYGFENKSKTKIEANKLWKPHVGGMIQKFEKRCLSSKFFWKKKMSCELNKHFFPKWIPIT